MKYSFYVNTSNHSTFLTIEEEVKGFKAELANFKAKNYLDKGIVNMSALTIEKLGKEDENNVYYRINRNSI